MCGVPYLLLRFLFPNKSSTSYLIAAPFPIHTLHPTAQPKMTPKRVMKETTRQEAPPPLEPLGYFCVQHGSVPMELDCAHVWKLKRESAKWWQTNATPSRLPPLTGAFARDWNKLPAELKLRIFSFVTGSALAASPCSHKYLLRWHDMEMISRRIIQFARCTPEFKILAEQTIYSEHQFAIDTWLEVSMPPSKYVRLLTIELDLYDRVHQARRIL